MLFLCKVRVCFLFHMLNTKYCKYCKYCREYVSVIIQSRLYRWMRTVKGIHYVQRINRFLICLYTCSPNFIVVSLKWTKLRQSLWIDVHQLGWPTEPNSCLNLERNLVLYVSSLKLYLSISYIFKYSWNKCYMKCVSSWAKLFQYIIWRLIKTVDTILGMSQLQFASLIFFISTLSYF